LCAGFIACSNLTTITQNILFIETLINAYTVRTLLSKRKNYKKQ